LAKSPACNDVVGGKYWMLNKGACGAGGSKRAIQDIFHNGGVKGERTQKGALLGPVTAARNVKKVGTTLLTFLLLGLRI